jgi:hypothetical protein
MAASKQRSLSLSQVQGRRVAAVQSPCSSSPRHSAAGNPLRSDRVYLCGSVRQFGQAGGASISGFCYDEASAIGTTDLGGGRPSCFL